MSATERRLKTTLEDIGVNLINIIDLCEAEIYTIAGRRHSNGFDRVNAHKRIGSGPVLVRFIANGRIWMHREFAIMRDYTL